MENDQSRQVLFAVGANHDVAKTLGWQSPRASAAEIIHQKDETSQAASRRLRLQHQHMVTGSAVSEHVNSAGPAYNSSRKAGSPVVGVHFAMSHPLHDEEQDVAHSRATEVARVLVEPSRPAQGWLPRTARPNTAVLRPALAALQRAVGNIAVQRLIADHCTSSPDEDVPPVGADDCGCVPVLGKGESGSAAVPSKDSQIAEPQARNQPKEGDAGTLVQTFTGPTVVQTQRRPRRSGRGAAASGHGPATGISPAPGVTCRSSARACFSVSRRTAWLLDHGRVLLEARALGGRPGHRTPIGRFSVHSKDPDHVSSSYRLPNGRPAPMQFYVNFDTLVGFHAGRLDVPSHGCVHLSTSDARSFFNHLNVGDHVDVVR